MRANNVVTDTATAFRALRKARKDLRQAIRYADAHPSEEARRKRTDALEALNKAQRQYEELAIMRDVVWQQTIKTNKYEQTITI